MTKERITFKTTAAGKLVVFLLFWIPLAAVITVNNFMFIIFTMLIGLFGVSHVMAKRNLRAVSLSRRFPDEVYAETPFPIRYLSKASQVPWGAFSLAFREDRPLEATDGEVKIPEVPLGDARSHTGFFTLCTRGDREIGPGLLLSAFPFGLATYARACGQTQSVLIFPRIEPVEDEVPLWVGTAGGGKERADPFGSAPYLFRQYVAGDPYKLIDWKKSAGAGGLVTRILAEPGATEIAIRLPADATEQAISRAASLVLHFAVTRRPVSLYGPGVTLGPGQGRDFARKCLTALARWESVTSTAAVPEYPAAITVDVDSRGAFEWKQGA